MLVQVGVAVRSLVRTTCPHGKDEKAVQFLSLAYFLSFSLIFACNVDTSLQPEIMGYDTFVNIDSEYPKLALSKALSWNVRHPLFVLFNMPTLLVTTILRGGKMVCLCILLVYDNVVEQLVDIQDMSVL